LIRGRNDTTDNGQIQFERLTLIFRWRTAFEER
jgi:hypothetical protein